MRVRVLTAVVVMLAAAAPATATLIVPMSDEDLVASSDVIATGTVERIESRLLPGRRIVTRITLALEGTLKGSVPEGSLVLTEAGGRVGGLVVGTIGAPEYTTGERVLAMASEKGLLA